MPLRIHQYRELALVASRKANKFTYFVTNATGEGKIVVQNHEPRRYLTTGKTSAAVASLQMLPSEGKCPVGKDDAPNPKTVSAITSIPVVPLKELSEIPGPKGLPFVGTLWDYMKPNGLQFNKLFEVYRQRAEMYGPIFKEQLGHIRTVVVSDPQEYQKLIRAEANWPYPERYPLEPLVHYKTKRKMPLGVVHAQGPEWHEHRILLVQKTLKMSEIGAYAGHMSEVAEELIDRLRTLSSNRGGVVPKLNNEVFKWALESLGTFLFDERLGVLDGKGTAQAQTFLDNLLGMFKGIQVLLYSFPIYKVVPTPAWRRFEKHTDKVMEIANFLVSKKAGEPFDSTNAHPSLLQYLLHQKNLTPEEAGAHTMDLLIGGIETTSNATLWSLYELARNPIARRKVQEEVDRELANKKTISKSDIDRLPYIKAVIKETFRLYPVTFATTRIIPEDLEIAGYRIPARTHVQGNIYGMGRNKDIFPDPTNYNPDRWLRGNMDSTTRFLHSLVWGHGGRMCLGRRIAEQEITIILAKNFDVTREGVQNPDVEPILYTVMNLDRDLKVKLTSRVPTKQSLRFT